MVQAGSVVLNYPSLNQRNQRKLWLKDNLSWVRGGSNQTTPPESPWTHEKLSYDPCFLCSRRFGNVEPLHTRVQPHWTSLNHPWTHEKLSYDPCSLQISVVPGGTVLLNSWPTNYPIIVISAAVLQGGSLGMKRSKLMRHYPMLLVPLDICASRRFSAVVPHWRWWNFTYLCSMSGAQVINQVQ